jgi:hypothetical protein
MSEEWETYVRLREYSDKLDKNGNSVRKEDPEAARKLHNFGIIINRNLFWKEKSEYIELFKDFLYGTLTADDFSNIFGVKYHDRMRQKTHELKIDLKENSYQSSELVQLIIKGKYYKSYKLKFSNMLSLMESETEAFRIDPEPDSTQIGEKELRIFAKKTLSKMEKLPNESK